MTLGAKVSRLRVLEGHARGLGRELTQAEVAGGVRQLGGRMSQSYLSQIENGSRPHLTGETRLLLARFFKVHPGYLVDDPEDMVALHPPKPRRELDDRLDLWLIEGSEEFGSDPHLSRALLAIAKHEKSRDCLLLLGSLVENKLLVSRLVEQLVPQEQPRRQRRATGRSAPRP